MKLYFFKLCIALTLLLLGCQLQETKLSKKSDKGLAEIDHFLQEAVDQNDIPGVVAVVANKDKILYYRAFGKREVANNMGMQKDDLFYIVEWTTVDEGVEERLIGEFTRQ